MIRSTFLLPALIALASIIGLASALTGDGWRDVVAWVALAVPIGAVVWARFGHLFNQRDHHRDHS